MHHFAGDFCLTLAIRIAVSLRVLLGNLSLRDLSNRAGYALVTVGTRRTSPHCPNPVETSCYVRVINTNLSRSCGNELKNYNQREAGFIGEVRI